MQGIVVVLRCVIHAARRDIDDVTAGRDNKEDEDEEEGKDYHGAQATEEVANGEACREAEEAAEEVAVTVADGAVVAVDEAAISKTTPQ